MVTRRKSKKKNREDAEIIDLLKHMHQLDRNELIARIQQRDQYIICIISAIIVFLIGLIQTQSKDILENTSLWFLLGCLVAWFFMVMMTYRLINSYDIHDQLIEHTKLIDDAFKKKMDKKLTVLPWQEFIDTQLSDRRKKSYNLTVISFIIADIFTFAALLYVTTMEVGNRMGFSNVFSFSISMSIALFITILLYLWERGAQKKRFAIMPSLAKKLLPPFRKILIFILPLLLPLLPFLFQSIAQHQALLTEDPSWGVKFADIIMLALLVITNGIVRTVVSGFIQPAYETEDNDRDVILANYTGACIFYIVFCFHFLTYEDAITWIAFLLGGYCWITGFNSEQFGKLRKGIRLQGRLKTIIGFAAAYGIFWAYLEGIFTLPPEWFDAAFVGAATGIVLSLVPLSIIAKAFDRTHSSSNNNGKAPSENAQEHKHDIHVQVSVTCDYSDKEKLGGSRIHEKH